MCVCGWDREWGKSLNPGMVNASCLREWVWNYVHQCLDTIIHHDNEEEPICVSDQVESIILRQSQYTHIHMKVISLPSAVKSNKGGNSRPVESLVSGFLSSSKNGCTNASLAVNRACGSYCNTREIKSIASGCTLDRNTYIYANISHPDPL